MNPQRLWNYTALATDLLEVINYLDSDPSYDNAMASEAISQILTNRIIPLIDAAIHEGGNHDES